MSYFLIAITFAIVVSSCFGLHRMIFGPRHLDRILALDFLSIVGLAATVILTAVTDEPMVLDIGLCLSLVGFFTAYLLSKFVMEEGE